MSSHYPSTHALEWVDAIEIERRKAVIGKMQGSCIEG